MKRQRRARTVKNGEPLADVSQIAAPDTPHRSLPLRRWLGAFWSLCSSNRIAVSGASALLSALRVRPDFSGAPQLMLKETATQSRQLQIGLFFKAELAM